MNIYFTASLSKKEQFGNIYERIVNHLDALEHTVFEKVLSEHVADVNDISQHNLKSWVKEWSTYVKNADCVVVEGSYPSSIHIGFELGLILARHKPVILLHKKGADPTLINKYHSRRLVKSEYEEDDLEDVLDWCLEELESVTNRRFTFYISPEIDAFLEKIANNTGLTRSEYIRKLIEREIDEES